MQPTYPENKNLPSRLQRPCLAQPAENYWNLIGLSEIANGEISKRDLSSLFTLPHMSAALAPLARDK